MAGKLTGLGATISVDDSAGSLKDISNDVHNYNFSTPRGVQDTTGVDKSAMERLLLLADFSVTFAGTFDIDSAKSHQVFKTVSSTSVARTVTIAGIGGVSLSNETLFSDYAVTRADSGELTWTTAGALSDGTVPTWA